MNQLPRFRKAIVAVIGAGAVALTTALGDGTMGPADWASVAVAVLTALGVYSFPNAPPVNPVERWTAERLAPAEDRKNKPSGPPPL